MREAIKESLQSITKKEGRPFGAVIVRNKKIIARGHNLVTSSNDPTAHAEIVAIRKASQKLKKIDLSDCKIYTTCEPCPMCFSAIHWSKIKKVYFGCTRKDAAKIGFDDQILYDILSGKEKEKQFVLKKLNRKECLTVFKEWKKQKEIKHLPKGK